MTLASVVLGTALSKEEDTDNDSPLPPHLMVPVDIRKGLGGKGYYCSSALDDSGAIHNFLSQAVVDKPDLEAAKAGESIMKRKMLLLITTVNGEPQHATAVVYQMLQMHDSAGTKQSHGIKFVIADIAHYD